MTEAVSPTKRTIVDLFSGCGGLSLGAAQAGFRSLTAVDIDPTLQSGYRKNFPGSKPLQASVSDIEASDWPHLIGRVRPDAVVGGPPCQGFSWIGKRKTDDPRNDLVFQFFRQVRTLLPKFFIMENVEGILHERNRPVLDEGLSLVCGRYRILGPLVVNAADFGAATNRKRIVIVGYDRTDVDDIHADTFRASEESRRVTVRDAIVDLPDPTAATFAASEFEWAAYPDTCSSELSDYAINMRRPPPAGLGWRESIAYQALGRVSGLMDTKHSPVVAARYEAVPGGKTDRITKSYRLEWEGLSPTLRAGTGSDKGAFQAVRPLHPSKPRVITVREAARLQGFPDWFVFHPTKWHSFRMIGNSVSPKVAQALFDRIAPRMHAALA